MKTILRLFFVFYFIIYAKYFEKRTQKIRKKKLLYVTLFLFCCFCCFFCCFCFLLFSVRCGTTVRPLLYTVCIHICDCVCVWVFTCSFCCCFTIFFLILLFTLNLNYHIFIHFFHLQLLPLKDFCFAFKYLIIQFFFANFFKCMRDISSFCCFVSILARNINLWLLHNLIHLLLNYMYARWA